MTKEFTELVGAAAARISRYEGMEAHAEQGMWDSKNTVTWSNACFSLYCRKNSLEKKKTQLQNLVKL